MLNAWRKGRLAPQAAAVWYRFLGDPLARGFEGTLAAAVLVGLAGDPPPLREDGVAFGRAFEGGAPWTQAFTDLVSAAAADLAD